MRTYIPDNLACVYDITVPYTFNAGKLRKKLDAELEKLHPCYPEQCAVDYRLRFRTFGNKKDGFQIRAIVMDRTKLADLRKKNRGRPLYMGGRRPYAVFAREARNRRRTFIVVTLLSGIIVFAAIRLFQSEPAVTVQEVPEATPAVEETAPELSAVEEPPRKDFAEFFTAVYELGGRFTSLSWNAAAGDLSLRTEGLFPEQLAAASSDFGEVRFGPVTYRESVPEFSVTFMADTAGTLLPGLGAAAEMAAIRQLLFDCGGQPVSESVDPPSITGMVPVSSWASFAGELSSMLAPVPADTDSPHENEWEWPPQLLELSRDEHDVTVSLTLADEKTGDCLHQIPFQSVVPLFYDAPDLPYAPVAEEPPQTAPAEKDVIGRITREDGSSVVFFHNKDGKIERRIYEN